MCQYISNKLVFTGAQVLDSLFLMLMYILTYSDSSYENHTGSGSLDITAEDVIWLHLVETRAATPGRSVARASAGVLLSFPRIIGPIIELSCRIPASAGRGSVPLPSVFLQPPRPAAGPAAPPLTHSTTSV